MKVRFANRSTRGRTLGGEGGERDGGGGRG